MYIASGNEVLFSHKQIEKDVVIEKEKENIVIMYNNKMYKPIEISMVGWFCKEYVEVVGVR